MSLDDLVGIDFSESLRDVSKGDVVKPQLKTFLFEAKFQDEFSVRFKKGDSNRPPDGWFWPSTHPVWPERMLYTYLTEPETLPREERRYMNTLSLTMGTAVHGFIETCLEQIGLRPKTLNTCTMCSHGECSESGVFDAETKSRGHMDGVLDLSRLLRGNKILHEISAFEFKTLSTPQAIQRLEAEGVDYYRKKWPEYYAQNQEYLRLSGLPSIVVLFMRMGYPWTMVELHIAADPIYQRDQRDKYLRVREAAEATVAPDCCHSSGCALKDLCSVEQGKAGRQVLMERGGRIGIRR